MSGCKTLASFLKTLSLLSLNEILNEIYFYFILQILNEIIIRCSKNIFHCCCLLLNCVCLVFCLFSLLKESSKFLANFSSSRPNFISFKSIPIVCVLLVTGSCLLKKLLLSLSESSLSLFLLLFEILLFFFFVGFLAGLTPFLHPIKEIKFIYDTVLF